MKTKILGFVILLMLSSSAYAQPWGSVTSPGLAKWLRSATTLPATCKAGEIYRDSDATSGQQIYLCESANTWKLQGDGGASGGDNITVNTVTAIDTTANLKDTATVTWAVTDGGAGGPDDIEATVGTTFPELTIDAAGVNLDTDGDGALSISGLGNGFDEDLTFNFDDVENTVGISTGSGVTLIDFSAIGLTTTGDVNAANMKITGVFNAGADDDPADVYIHSGGGLWVYEDSNDFVVGAVCKDGAAEWQFDDDVNIGASGAAEDLILWGNLKTATPTTLSAAELDRLDGLTSAIIDNDKMDASSELLAIMDDETGSASGSPLLVFNQAPAIDGNIKNTPRQWHISIVNPNAVVTASSVIPIVTLTDAALTVTKIVVSTSSASYEAAGDLKYADARIGLANATVINAFDTTSGVLSDDSITSGSVASGKTVYLSFDSAPNASMTDMVIDVYFDYD